MTTPLKNTQKNPAFFTLDGPQQTFYCQGAWTLTTLMKIKQTLQSLDDADYITIIDGSSLTEMDSAGAMVLQQWIKNLRNKSCAFKNFDAQHLKLLELILNTEKKFNPLPLISHTNILTKLGQLAAQKITELTAFLNFLGAVTVTGFKLCFNFKRLPVRSIIHTIETAGIYAVPLIALLSFLIGMVLAYQMGMQLKNYGANIYIADLLGLSILREFAPLMTAIIIAGRSGSAFTAQLGTMKIREEIDALTTMGLSPIVLLIIPNMIGLCIAVPLLTILASIFGIAGGMLVAKTMLHIGYIDFLHRFYQAIPARSFWVGMIKAPIFGWIIASIGCFQGMQVFGSAVSVGQKTTVSVVQSIFVIIITDAVFSIIFNQLGF